MHVVTDTQNKEVKVLVNPQFYSKDFVTEALYAYSKNCWVQMDNTANKKLLIRLKPKTANVPLDKLGFEFYNYMLGLMQNASD